ncbi:hypothetical protein BH09VER1_BH09VER1_36220 [soil metagenome]
MKLPNRGPCGRWQEGRAFTLIELLVATAVAILLMVAVVSVIGRVSGIWQDAFARTSSRQSARTALQFMTRELQSIRLPVHRARSTDPRELGLQFLLSPKGIDAKFLNPNAIFFQASLSSSNPNGDIGIIGYFVYWDETDPGHPKPQLRRLAIAPDSPDFKVYSDPTAWLNTALVESLATPSASAPLRGWFVDDVLAIFVRGIDIEGNPIGFYSNPILLSSAGTSLVGPTYEYDSRRGYRIVVQSPVRTIAGPVLPASVEVALVVVSPRAAKNITTKLVPSLPSNANPSTFWTDIRAFINGLPPNVKSGVRLYSTRIQLPAPI